MYLTLAHAGICTSYFPPASRRAVHGKNIVAQVPAKLLFKSETAVKLKMYELEKPLTFTDAEFRSLFQPYDPTPEFVKGFEMSSITEGDLRIAAERFNEHEGPTTLAIFGKCVMEAYMSCGNAKSCPITKYEAMKAAGHF